MHDCVQVKRIFNHDNDGYINQHYLNCCMMLNSYRIDGTFLCCWIILMTNRSLFTNSGSQNPNWYFLFLLENILFQWKAVIYIHYMQMQNSMAINPTYTSILTGIVAHKISTKLVLPILTWKHSVPVRNHYLHTLKTNAKFHGHECY